MMRFFFIMFKTLLRNTTVVDSTGRLESNLFLSFVTCFGKIVVEGILDAITARIRGGH